ncbi:MAG TPA: glycoside hydrolase family 16 protein [Polyangia bacterium]
MAPARHRRSGRWLARTAVIVAVAAAAQGTLAATAGAATPVTKMATAIIRTHLRSQGKYELIVYVRSRTKHDKYVKIFVSGQGSERVLAKPWWGAAAHFKFTFTGKELTIRTVNSPPAVQIRTTLIRKTTPTRKSTPTNPPAAAPPVTTPAPAPTPTPAPAVPADPFGPYTTVVWEDNFAQDFVAGGSVANQLPNPNTWSFDTWGGCGTNTLSVNRSGTDPNRAQNASLTANGLALTATSNGSGGWNAAQIDSIGNAHFGPGTSIEARIMLPLGQGLCPAFWMIGDNTSNEGEIDVVEAPTFSGQLTPATVWFDLHGPSNPSQEYEGSGNTGASLGGAWHDFEITWESNELIWSIDGTVYGLADAANLTAGNWSTFAAPNTFHLLFDLAVGGWPCNGAAVGPGCSPPSSATMYVQWVKAFGS